MPDLQGEQRVVKSKTTTSKAITFVILIIVLIVTISILVLPPFYRHLAKDSPPPEDRDLQEKRVTIPREENAYYSLINARNSLYGSSESSNALSDHLQSEKWDQGFVQDVLSKNRQAMMYFDEAATKAKFQDPTIGDYEKLSGQALLSFREIARVSSLKAEYLFRLRREREAFEGGITIIENGHKIQESQGSLISYFTGTDAKHIGLVRINRITGSTSLAPERLVSYVEKLEKYKQNEQGLINAFKNEYGFFVWAIDEAYSGTQKPSARERVVAFKEMGSYFKKDFYFKRNKTKSLFADFVRSQIGDVEVPCGLRKVKETKRLSPRSHIKWFITENIVGKLLYDTAVPSSVGSMHEMKCEDDLLVSATQVLLALRAYKKKTGKYPSSLDELVPRYIEKVPEDPFDGKPLRYSAEKKVVYSVGMDLVDSGGVEGKRGTQTGDRVFRIKF